MADYGLCYLLHWYRILHFPMMATTTSSTAHVFLKSVILTFLLRGCVSETGQPYKMAEVALYDF